MKREKAIDLLNLYSVDELGEAKLDTWYHGIDEHMREALGMAIEALSADRPTGEWIENHNGTFTCDQCGCKHSKSNYCPNCGARMEGGEEE